MPAIKLFAGMSIRLGQVSRVTCRTKLRLFFSGTRKWYSGGRKSRIQAG
jgi:hypothetical protein